MLSLAAFPNEFSLNVNLIRKNLGIEHEVSSTSYNDHQSDNVSAKPLR